MMEKQQIGLTKAEWKTVLNALAIMGRRPDDSFNLLYHKLGELLGNGAK